MKVSDLLESRRENWRELDALCTQLETRARRKLGAQARARFSLLYRAACADLALADAYQLPQGTVQFLHHLVGRAHNQFYRSQGFHTRSWLRQLFFDVPQRLFEDNYLRLAFVLFWGVFLLSFFLAYTRPGFAEQVAGKEFISGVEEMHSGGPTGGMGQVMSGFYIWNNAGIGLRCFAFGLLFGVGGLYETFFNAAVLGAVFGHMAQVPDRSHFFQFVTAHGPFELTAVVLSAAAGLRLGFSLVNTKGLGRVASLQRAAKESMPIAAAAVVLFVLAALIEAFISPTTLPYPLKASVALVSAASLMFYFVILGRPREP